MAPRADKSAGQNRGLFTLAATEVKTQTSQKKALRTCHFMPPRSLTCTLRKQVYRIESVRNPQRRLPFLAGQIRNACRQSTLVAGFGSSTATRPRAAIRCMGGVARRHTCAILFARRGVDDVGRPRLPTDTSYRFKPPASFFCLITMP